MLLRPAYVELQRLAKSLSSEHQHFIIRPLPQYDSSVLKSHPFASSFLCAITRTLRKYDDDYISTQFHILHME